jgi:hypothetical protein
MRILLLLFGMGPKLVSHTETRTQHKVPEKRVVRKSLEIKEGKEK